MQKPVETESGRDWTLKSTPTNSDFWVLKENFRNPTQQTRVIDCNLILMRKRSTKYLIFTDPVDSVNQSFLAISVQSLNRAQLGKSSDMDSVSFCA